MLHSILVFGIQKTAPLEAEEDYSDLAEACLADFIFVETLGKDEIN